MYPRFIPYGFPLNFQVLSTSKVEIIESHYIPGHEFPEKEEELNGKENPFRVSQRFGPICKVAMEELYFLLFVFDLVA